MKFRQVRLKRHVVGIPAPDDFDIAEVEVPDPAPGSIVVRNLWLSVDPYIRGLLSGQGNYLPAIRLGELIPGAAIGRVVAAGKETPYAIGDLVRSHTGWCEGFTAPSEAISRLPPIALPIQTYLGALGAPGLTAYVGLLDIGKPRTGETVFVSGAAGSVGGLVCQLARISGCRVVASAGSVLKCTWLQREAGVDVAINYRESVDLAGALRAACPDGIDIYFDNVGGSHLEAALDLMNVGGRIAACGAISAYNDETPTPAPRNLFQIVTQRLLMQGFLVTDHWDRLDESAEAFHKWLMAGQIVLPEAVSEGLDSVVDAFAGLFRGDNLGKTLVHLGN